jgi:hypothetical protein
MIADAGEYYVAFRLAKMGISSAMVSKGSKSVDILGTIDGSRSVSIQVKSTAWHEASLQWDVGKNKPVPSETFYFVFVNIWKDKHDERKPEVLVVPSEDVRSIVKWESKRPQFRLTKESAEEYRDKWGPIERYLCSDQDVEHQQSRRY